MDQSEINEGNALIAEFLGWEKDTILQGHYTVSKGSPQLYFNEMTVYRPCEMRFHKDWNWTMQAWDKIRRTVFEENDNSYPDPFAAMTDVWEMKCLLADRDTAFEILVEAIKWHNTL